MTEVDKTLYELATLIAAYSNPHMFPFDGFSILPEAERQEELDSLKGMMEELIG